MKDSSTGIKGRGNSFKYAFAGIVQLLKQEVNMRIHFAASAFAIGMGLVQGISRLEWLGIVLAISLVWITEAINTAIEMLCNIVCDNQYHPMVKIIKDISAGAVLLAAITSIVVAGLIFLA